jgi:CRP/FNR family cyclic AMP-dependent transcriptional regulator
MRTALVAFDWETPTSLPLVTRSAGEIILSAGSKTDRLMILKRGAVVVLKDSVEIARVNQPGAVFGEISALLNVPHAADVLASEYSEFYIADAKLLQEDPIALLYVARIIAARLLAADNSLVEAKKRTQAGQIPPTLDELLKAIDEIFAKLP